MVLKILNYIFTFIRSVCKVMMMIQVVSVTIVFIGRYIFNITPAWGEELTLFCLVWMCLVGAALPIRDDSHLKMTIIDFVMPKRGIKILKYTGDVLILIFCVIVFKYGVNMTIQVTNSILHGIKISKAYLYAAVPTAMVFIALAIIEKYYKMFLEYKMQRGNEM